MTGLGKKMKKAREEGGISIYEMADVCGVSHLCLVNIEKGIIMCPAEVLIAYAEVIGISIDKIVYGYNDF